MNLSLLLQQCPAGFVCLTWIVCEREGKWPYSHCFVGCCFQDLFKQQAASLSSPHLAFSPIRTYFHMFLLPTHIHIFLQSTHLHIFLLQIHFHIFLLHTSTKFFKHIFTYFYDIYSFTYFYHKHSLPLFGLEKYTINLNNLI